MCFLSMHQGDFAKQTLQGIVNYLMSVINFKVAANAKSFTSDTDTVITFYCLQLFFF